MRQRRGRRARDATAPTQMVSMEPERAATSTHSVHGGSRVTLVTATAIVVADMIGIGVFTSLGFQVKDIHAGFTLILLWIVGGGVALCGALSYAELAAMFPRSSGEYNLLNRSYHPAFGFMAGFLSATVGFAAPVALAAMAFGEYAKPIIPGASPLVLGLALVWFVSLIGIGGIGLSSRFQVISTAIKIALIVVFIIAGFTMVPAQPISFAPSTEAARAVFTAPFAIGLVFVMYSYSGWNAATYIIGEMTDPPRDLPRALLGGTAIVLLLYVLLNAVFLRATPIDKLAGQLDVAQVAGTHIFGPTGGLLVGALICIGLVSSVAAMMWIGPRVTMTMGEDVPVMRVFARTTAGGAPVAAILFQLVVASLLLLTQSFESVLDFIQFSLLTCSFFTVLGVIKLRIQRPDLPRPYRAWGYPVTPAIFLAVTAFMMYYLATERPWQSLAGAVIMASGVGLYWLSRWHAAATSAATIRSRD